MCPIVLDAVEPPLGDCGSGLPIIGIICQLCSNELVLALPEVDDMPTRNVVLSEHQQQLVETLVQSGRYQNASEVLREGLRLIEDRDRIEDTKLKALKQAARQGWAHVSAGRYSDVADDQLEDFVGQLGRRAAQRAKSAG